MKVIMFFWVLIFLSSGVVAVSGVSPGSYSVDFSPGLSQEFVFSFILDSGVMTNLFVEGDLAKYVSLDKKRIFGKEKVVASLNLPSEVDSPGVNNIRIVAGNVVGIIKVNVPYPEKWVALEMSVPNINIEEDANLNLKVFSLGEESVIIESKIEIYEDEKVIKTIEMDSEEVASGGLREFNFLLDSSNYSAGDYYIVASVDYNDEVVRVNKTFRVGELRVEILDYTSEIKAGKIVPFEVEVESLWNNNINDLYVEVSVLGFNDSTFSTLSIKLNSWQIKKVEGFLNTRGIDAEEVEAEVVVYYMGQKTSKIVKLKVELGFDYVYWGVVLAVFIILIFVAWRVLVFVKNAKKIKRGK
ncbi:MAG: hypothetical protein ABIF18_02420 [archaeon]